MLDGRYFHEYPYTDFHELNTDWIINEELEIRKRIEDYLKKIDDLLSKQADLDKKVDDVTNHVNDVENEVNNKIGDITNHIDDAENRINKKIDDANDHVDDVENNVNAIQPKIDEQNQKINDIDNKNNENQTKINDSVKSVSYDNDLDISDGNVKLIGRIHVEKPNTGDVVTPVYGYVGGGTLGNCVVWSKTPYVGIGEQKDYVMKNPQYNTLMEFPINGSFLAVFDKAMVIVTDGSLVIDGIYGDDVIRNGTQYLITPDSLVCLWTYVNQSHDTRIMTPKVASGISFEEAVHHISGHGASLSLQYNSDHLYAIRISGNFTYKGYIINGLLTTIVPNSRLTISNENNTFICTLPTDDNYAVDVSFLDLGSMV